MNSVRHRICKRPVKCKVNKTILFSNESKIPPHKLLSVHFQEEILKLKGIKVFLSNKSKKKNCPLNYVLSKKSS